MEQGPPVRLVTAYRESPKFDEEYIGRLAAGFYGAHPEAEERSFRVVEDTRWPGWWCKMAVFEFIAKSGVPWWYADLDTVISGPLPRVPDPDRLVVVHDFYSMTIRPQTGFMFIPTGVAERIWSKWIQAPEKRMSHFGSDGRFVEHVCQTEPHSYWRDVSPGAVVSFKAHCWHERPAGASVVCYHGEPWPRETQWADSGASRFCKSYPVRRCPTP